MAAKDNLAGALTANEYKVIIIGGLGVGKTSILLRFVHDTFEDRVSRFVAEEKKTVTVDGQEVVLDIWDTAGELVWRRALVIHIAREWTLLGNAYHSL